MSQLTLKVKKVNQVNPRTKAMGYSARVLTNGRESFEDLVDYACHNTALHKVEVSGAVTLMLEAASRALKNGKIVDLGPLGTLKPSVQSKWVADPKELTKADLTKSIVYSASADVDAAIQAAKLSWSNKEEEEADNSTDPENTTIDDNNGNNGGGSSTGTDTSGNGSGTTTVAAPTIDGATPFTDTTEVTITGPEDAEIRYTTDGTSPNAQSTLYDAAFTLSDTTTVKAIAIKNGESSEVSTKLFSKGTDDEPGGSDH